MHKLKYIKVTGDLNESVFLFPGWETHADVAFRLGFPVISAGFVKIDVDDAHQLQVVTFGRSQSLNLESDPEDAHMIVSMLKSV